MIQLKPNTVTWHPIFPHLQINPSQFWKITRNFRRIYLTYSIPFTHSYAYIKLS